MVNAQSAILTFAQLLLCGYATSARLETIRTSVSCAVERVSRTHFTASNVRVWRRTVTDVLRLSIWVAQGLICSVSLTVTLYVFTSAKRLPQTKKRISGTTNLHFGYVYYRSSRNYIWFCPQIFLSQLQQHPINYNLYTPGGWVSSGKRVRK